MESLKFYIAGPDVFETNPKEIGKNYKDYIKNKCEYWEGIYPLDNESESAKMIFAYNIAMIQKCDIVVANLNNFRGDDMDSGTAFEIGMAIANKKLVFGYMDDTRPLTDKIKSKYLINDYFDKSNLVDLNGKYIENFNLPVNLMIGVPLTIQKLNNITINGIIKGTFFDCIDYIYNLIEDQYNYDVHSFI